MARLKKAFAYLDLKSIKEEYDESREVTEKCLKKMAMRGIETLYVSEISQTTEVREWMIATQINPRRTLFLEKGVGWLDRIRKRYTKDWKSGMVQSSLSNMDRGRSDRDIILVFDHNEAIRQSITALDDPRVQVFSSLKEIADSMDIPLEEFDENDPYQASLKKVIEARQKTGIEDNISSRPSELNLNDPLQANLQKIIDRVEHRQKMGDKTGWG